MKSDIVKIFAVFILSVAIAFVVCEIFDHYDARRVARHSAATESEGTEQTVRVEFAVGSPADDAKEATNELKEAGKIVKGIAVNLFNRYMAMGEDVVARFFESVIPEDVKSSFLASM